MKKYISLIISGFCLFLTTSSLTHAAVGDCLTWIWGGKNQETTYSPPSSQNNVVLNSSGVLSPSPLAVQTTIPSQSVATTTLTILPSTGVPVLATSPAVQPYVAASPIKSGSPEPILSTTTLFQPTVSKEWTFSRIKSVDYKPLQVVNPYDGTVSTVYQAEESQSLLPWLHQKEVVRYEPVAVPTTGPTISATTNPTSSVVQTYYPGPVVEPIAQTSYNTPTLYSYPLSTSLNPCMIVTDPCAGLGVVQTIPSSIVEGTTDSTIRSSDSSSTYIAPYGTPGTRSTGSVPNYGTPDMVIQPEKSRPSSTPSNPTSLNPTPTIADMVPVVNPTSTQPYNPTTGGTTGQSLNVLPNGSSPQNGTGYGPIQNGATSGQAFRPELGVVSPNNTGTNAGTLEPKGKTDESLMIPNTQLFPNTSSQSQPSALKPGETDPLSVSQKKGERSGKPIPTPIPAVGLPKTEQRADRLNGEEREETNKAKGTSSEPVRRPVPRVLSNSPASRMLPKRLQSPTRFDLQYDPIESIGR
ncbi:MAG: hypothetical protein ACRC10_07410 [Thermoguttaceae bacterium]